MCSSLGGDHVCESRNADDEAVTDINGKGICIPFTESHLWASWLESDVKIPVVGDQIQHGRHRLKEGTIDDSFDWLSRGSNPCAEPIQGSGQAIKIFRFATGQDVDVLRGEGRSMQDSSDSTDDDIIHGLVFQDP